MTRLLRAGMHRYFKNALFLICLCASLAQGLWLGHGLHRDVIFDEQHEWIVIFGFFISAVFVAFTVGKEYAHGGFRKKVALGHSRIWIVVSELLLSLLGGTLLCAVAGLGVLVWNLHWLSRFPGNVFFLFVLGVWLFHLALCALFSMLSLLIPSRAVSAVAGLLLVFGMFIAVSDSEVKLRQAEYQRVIYFTETHVEFTEEYEKNPQYVGGVKRKLLEGFLKVAPMGQLRFYEDALYPYFFTAEGYDTAKNSIVNSQTGRFDPVTEEELQQMCLFPLYSLLAILGFSLIGCTGFCKRGLR